ncbi:MAG: SDR family NAD(P)-dependent oxidoreductase, partial [Allomuricauda sp.]
MKFSLNGKVVLVTGGGSGIGKAISKTLAEYGAFVNILELSLERAQKTVDEIRSQGGKAAGHQCNVSNQGDVAKLANSIAQSSPIDILINNAGIAHVGNIEETTENDLDNLYNVNIKGVYNCIHSCIKHMKKKGGVIINMAS